MCPCDVQRTLPCGINLPLHGDCFLTAKALLPEMEPKASSDETGFNPLLCITTWYPMWMPTEKSLVEGEKKIKEGKSPIFAVTLFQAETHLSMSACSHQWKKVSRSCIFH